MSAIKENKCKFNLSGNNGTVLCKNKTRYPQMQTAKQKPSLQHRLHKWFSLKFPESYLDWESPEKGQRAQWPKHCDNSNKYEDNSPNVNNVNPTSQKFRQKISFIFSSIFYMNFLFFFAWNLSQGKKHLYIIFLCSEKKTI